MEFVWLVVGVALGAGAAGAVFRSRRLALTSEIGRLEQAVEHERAIGEEKTKLAEQVEANLDRTIEAAAARAVKGNNEEFLALAGRRLEPIDQRLESFERQLRELETAREGAYGKLSEQVKGLMDAQELLRTEAGKLAGALSRPGTRGRWGELTLKRLVEQAGMVVHCDFQEQPTVEGADGRLRPDLLVHLPGGGDLPVDAKAPLDAYLKAMEATGPEARERRLDEHARALREHLVSLSRKGYWEQFERAPEFVVMFVPGEAFVAAAVEQRPDLFEEGFSKRVILASPTTLMALLRTVAHVWREERVAESAKEISELGRELHKRVSTMAGHFAQLGKRLDGAVGAYNKAVGSLERNVLPQARRFEEFGAGSGADVDALGGVETRARGLSAPELADDTADEPAEDTAGDRIVELARRSRADEAATSEDLARSEDGGTLGAALPDR